MKPAPPAAAALAACGALVGWACAAHPRPRPAVPLLPQAVGAVETYGPGLVATDDSGETVTFALATPAGVAVLRVWPGWRLEPLYPTRDRDTTYFQVGTHLVQVPRPVPWDTLALRPPATPAGQAAREQDAQRCISSELQRQWPPPEPRRRVADTTQRAQNPPMPAYYGNTAAIEYQCRKAAGLVDSAPARRDTLVERGAGYYLVLVASDVPQDARHLRLRLAEMDIAQSTALSVLQALPEVLAGPAARTWAVYEALVRAPAGP